LIRLGVPPGEPNRRGIDFISRYILKGLDKTKLEAEVEAVVKNPGQFVDDDLRGEFAKCLLRCPREIREATARWKQWGEGLDPEAINQMGRACQLPIAVAGALMPDAHVGYGLPIGGVLATDEAVIPYAVGVDIACRMKMTVFELPVTSLADDQQRFTSALQRETQFGVGASFKTRRQHQVMDADWNVSKITSGLKDRAWAQLGTSGSGNHFVEFGQLTVMHDGVGLPRGEYLALLSHSGSRGSGAHIAQHYSRLARDLHPELPRELSHLAWLDLASEAGQEYWTAMELMGRYAAANHALIHQHIARALGQEVLLDIENHHNFAWRERHRLPNGSEAEVIVHRKGATPAGAGTLGIIPGSMGAPGYIVRGRGVAASLNSAAHGAGRRMSRTRAKALFNWDETKRFLRERNVTLLSAGLDEVPMAYKNIEEVMAAQQDLVEPLARFDPRLVKMAPGNEPPED